MPRGRLILPLLLAATGGCASTGPFWGSRETCLRAPSDYQVHEGRPVEGVVDATGFHTGIAPNDRSTRVRVERRDCSFHVRVHTPDREVSLGPYTSVDPNSFIAHPGKARHAFLASSREGRVSVIVDGKASGPYRHAAPPMFSQNGAHVAYLATEGEETLVRLDDREIARGGPEDGPASLLAVLDDGRAVFQRRHPGGKTRLVAGAWTSAPFRSMANFTVWRDTRFAALLFYGDRGELVVDGWTDNLKGGVASGILFSSDGAHVLYVAMLPDLTGPFPRTTESFSAYLDGSLHALPSGAHPGAAFWGNVPVYFMSSSSQPPPAPRPGSAPSLPHGAENGVWIIGRATPSVPPTQDGFARVHEGRDAWFVQIGKSRGPLFDKIEPASLYEDERGHLFYRGVRGDQTFDVIDNVIQMLPLAPHPALKVPDAASAE